MALAPLARPAQIVIMCRSVGATLSGKRSCASVKLLLLRYRRSLSIVISILKTMKTQKKETQSFIESFLLGGEKKMVISTTVSTTVQRVHCPTCGSSAERYHSHESGTMRTQCSRCDYLMVSCTKTGRVIESYAPSFLPSAMAAG